MTGEDNINPYTPPKYIKVTSNKYNLTFSIPAKLFNEGCFLENCDVVGFVKE